jgi:hypothetical protein
MNVFRASLKFQLKNYTSSVRQVVDSDLLPRLASTRNCENCLIIQENFMRRPVAISEDDFEK